MPQILKKYQIFRIWHQKRPSLQPWFGGKGGGGDRTKKKTLVLCSAPCHARGGRGRSQRLIQSEGGRRSRTNSFPFLLIQSDLFCSLLFRRRLLLESEEEEEESSSVFMGERKWVGLLPPSTLASIKSVRSILGFRALDNKRVPSPFHDQTYRLMIHMNKRTLFGSLLL